MPVLDPRNADGNYDAWSVQRVLVVLASPTDAEARSRFLGRTAEQVHAVVENNVRKELSPEPLPDAVEEALTLKTGESLSRTLTSFGGFRALIGAPSYEQVREHVAGASWSGTIAGHILLTILQLDRDGVGGSVRKAIHVVQDFMGRATSLSGQTHGRSKRFIQESWRQYKSVAHMWAAYRIWFFENPVDESTLADLESPICPYRVEGLPGFLALSRILLDRGASHYPHGRNVPTLDQEAAWTTPSDLPLPEIRFETPRLEEWQTAALESYRP